MERHRCRRATHDPHPFPEAIEALKWIDQFGESRPVPAAFDDVIYALLNEGLIYQAAADRVDLTADGKSFLSDEYD